MPKGGLFVGSYTVVLPVVNKTIYLSLVMTRLVVSEELPWFTFSSMW